MKTINRHSIGGTLCACLLLGTSPAMAGIKCWTNSEGVRECGTTVPPQYVQQGHTVINPMGVEIGVGEHAPTEEEKVQQAREAELEQQRALQREEEERQRKEQEQFDRVLLSTYTSEQEIEYSRDEKIGAIESNIKLTASRMEQLRDNLDKLRKQAAAEEHAGRQVSDKRHQEILHAETQLSRNQDYIRDRHTEQEQLRVEYERKLERFRELKSGGTHTAD